MDAEARLKALRSVSLFAALPDARLASLAELLQPVSVADGQAFIVEGAPSDGLYYVASGRARVAKRLGAGGEKDLAFLGPGECLGEMEVLREGVRSASAYAVGPLELLKLKTSDLRFWLEKDPADAASFFSGLSDVQAGRLRRTSDEVALLYDLSQLLVAPGATVAGLLARTLERTTPHLQGSWSSEARAYNPFENEMDVVARLGGPFSPDGSEPAPADATDAAWTDDRTLQLILRGPKRLLGLLRFRADGSLDDAKRAEAQRTLTAVGRLLTSALENVEFRTDEALRERLKSRSHGPNL